MAEVSVVVTNYNYGKFLVKALESVLNQDYPQEKLEIILIDDASTDEATRRLVEEYEHPRVKKILLRENVGVVKARNIAIEQARGEYILPLDADDWFLPDYVRLAARVLDENPDAGLAYGMGELTGDASGPWLGPFDIEHVLLEGGTPACSMFRKSAWQEVGGYHDYMKNGWEDWDFWLSLIEQGYSIREVEGTMGFYYRIKAQSRTKDAAEKDLKELWRNLFMHHQKLYFAYPRIMQRVLIESSHGRVIAHSPEYRLGSVATKCMRAVLGPLLPLILRWKNRFRK